MSDTEPLISKEEDDDDSFEIKPPASMRHIKKSLNLPQHHNSEAHGRTQLTEEKTIISESEIRIVLLGKTGTGKSSTGNTIIGRKKFENRLSLESVTKTCESGEGTIGEKSVSVIDTPGLFDTKLSEQEIIGEIAKCVDKSAPGPHVFLLVIRLDTKYTDEEKNAVKWIQKNFGEDADDYTIILFTHDDELENQPLDEYISESNDLQALVEKCGGRFHSFNNKNMENRSQVTELLEKIEKMVVENGGECTNEMFQNNQRSEIIRDNQNLRIVLLGKTGSGKTSAAETIVGRESFTKTCKLKEAHVGGKKMKIIDTPGLIDASEKKMKKEIEKCVFMSAPGPHVFLLVIRVDEIFTEEEKNTVKWIQENLGKEAAQYTIILFTHADQLMGRSLDEYIRERKYLQSLVNSDGRFHSFSNQDTDNQNQAIELLKKIEKMAEENEWSCFTNESFQKTLKNKRHRLRYIAAGVGTTGTAGIVAGVVVMAVTDLVFPPALIITLGCLAVFGVAGAVTAVARAAKSAKSARAARTSGAGEAEQL